MGGLSSRSNSNMVQMRRSTNKKGKQAPAPPKRTRYFSIAIFLFKRYIIVTLLEIVTLTDL